MTTQLVRSAGPSGPAERVPTRRPLLIVAAVVVALVGSVLVVRAARPLTTDALRPEIRAAAGPRDVAAQGIDGLQRRLRIAPHDWRAWAALGSAYVQQARLTGDPTYYPKAEQSLGRSLAIMRDGNIQALAGMGSLAAARHDFSAALEWGSRARALDPYNAGVYGVVGDALIELGRYPEAFSAFQRMVDLRPGLASYARASYAWELQGNTSNATRAFELALEAASTPADAAFASYYLGELAWNSGRVADAGRWYRQASARDADYIPAMQGLAKIDAARGRLDEAIRRYTDLVARLPIPQYVIELGELYEVAGDRAMAGRQFDLLGVQQRLFQANGVNIDLEYALYTADHGNDVEAGLAAARAEWGRRKSVFVADALAWSLYANGRHREALAYAERALRLGTRNAMFVFHKGMIERALGLRAAAERDLRAALAINPNFSFRWAHRVPAILEALR